MQNPAVRWTNNITGALRRAMPAMIRLLVQGRCNRHSGGMQE